MARSVQYRTTLRFFGAKLTLCVGVLVCCGLWPAWGQTPNSSKAATISFRWDSEQIDWNYKTNALTQSEIQRLFTNPVVMAECDSIVINAAASPEGGYEHNQRLSERRLSAVLSYVREAYPLLRADKIRLHSKGPDWEGLRELVLADPNTPLRQEVLELIGLPIPPNSKANQLRLIGMGEVYRYMEQHTFSKLRTSTALMLFYPKRLEAIVNRDTTAISSIEHPDLCSVVQGPKPISYYNKIAPRKGEPFRYVRPFALKTNLLSDLVTVFNVELEVPIGRHVSILGEWTFPFWGGLGNRGGVAPVPAYSEAYTIQMLSASLEVRYWFARSKSLNQKAHRWLDYNPLSGWFMGVYGGAGMYDFQYNKRGAQGEFKFNLGITAGYAHPIGRHFHMEYSIGVGYLATEYYNYTAQDGQKVVHVLEDGTYDRRAQTWIGPTKAKVSIVWIPQFKVKKRR